MTSTRAEASPFSLRPRADQDGGETPQPPDDRDDVSVLSLLNVLLRRRRLILWPTLLLLAYVLIEPIVTRPPGRLYEAETSLEVEGGAAPSGNVVAQALGLAVSQNVTFPYARDLFSRTFLNSMLAERFTFSTEDGVRAGTLLSLSNVRGRTRKMRDQNAREWLLANVTFTNAPDGSTRLLVKAPWPALAESLSLRLIDRLNDRIVHRRQQRVTQERYYTLEILRAMKDSVDRAEERVATFMLRNRQYNTPILANELNRLNRELTIRQQTYSSLLAQYENARVDEVRNARMINIVDPPFVPDMDPPSWQLPKKGLVKVVFLAMGLAFFSLAADFVLAARVRNPGDYAEFIRLREQAFGWMLRPYQRLRERMRRQSKLSVR